MALYLYSNPLENSLFDDDDFFGSLIPYSTFGHPCSSRISRRIRHNHRWSPYKKMEKQLRKYFKEDHQKIVDFAPKINLTEDENNYYIHADLPGMKKDQVKMEINDDRVLTISGERKYVYKNSNDKAKKEEKKEKVESNTDSDEKQNKTKESNKKESKLTKLTEKSKEIQKTNNCKYSVMECSYGTFSRSFVIPENADLDTIQAKMENGVLEVTISKIEEDEQKNKNRSIQIQ